MAPVKHRTVKKTVSAQKAHFKTLSFNAFGAQAAATHKKRKSMKLARCRAVEAPEEGIHSFNWANSIVPQQSGLLRLPIEIRARIWFMVYETMECDVIAPMKRDKIFWSRNWQNSAHDATAIPETCRQIYVDVVGGSILYKVKQFSFSPNLMLNYLWVINPAHKNSLRSINLDIRVRHPYFSLPNKAFKMLAECEGLQVLRLEFKVDEALCHSGNLPSPPGTTTIKHNGRHVPLPLLKKSKSAGH